MWEMIGTNWWASECMDTHQNRCRSGRARVLSGVSSTLWRESSSSWWAETAPIGYTRESRRWVTPYSIWTASISLARVAEAMADGSEHLSTMASCRINDGCPAGDVLSTTRTDQDGTQRQRVRRVQREYWNGLAQPGAQRSAGRAEPGNHGIQRGQAHCEPHEEPEYELDHTGSASNGQGDPVGPERRTVRVLSQSPSSSQ